MPIGSIENMYGRWFWVGDLSKSSAQVPGMRCWKLDTWHYFYLSLSSMCSPNRLIFVFQVPAVKKYWLGLNSVGGPGHSGPCWKKIIEVNPKQFFWSSWKKFQLFAIWYTLFFIIFIFQSRCFGHLLTQNAFINILLVTLWTTYHKSLCEINFRQFCHNVAAVIYFYHQKFLQLLKDFPPITWTMI